MSLQEPRERRRDPLVMQAGMAIRDGSMVRLNRATTKQGHWGRSRFVRAESFGTLDGGSFGAPLGVDSQAPLGRNMNASFPDEELSNVLVQLGVPNEGFQSISLSGQVTASATAGVWRVSAPEGSGRPWSVILT